MDDLGLVQRIAASALPLLFAITVHEVAHGWAAKRLGDATAERLGRLTLNPIKHIDPIGTILVPGILLAMGAYIFGWAKPVPVTSENLRNPKRDMALVAAAGPVANLAMAVGWAALFKVAIEVWGGSGEIGKPLLEMAKAGIWINVMLMVVNLLPIPPLDGGRVATGLLPGPAAWQLSRVEPYGLFIFFGLFALGILGHILMPAITVVIRVIAMLFGL